MNPMLSERDHLRERMHRARSADERRYFEELLYQLERNMMVPPWHHDPMRNTPMTPPLGFLNEVEKPKAITPLSFLNTADKKLLLIGELA